MRCCGQRCQPLCENLICRAKGRLSAAGLFAECVSRSKSDGKTCRITMLLFSIADFDAIVVVVNGAYGILAEPPRSLLLFFPVGATWLCARGQLPYHSSASGTGIARGGAQGAPVTRAGKLPRT